MRTENLSTIDAKREKAEAWRDQVLQLAEGTLAIHTNSWLVMPSHFMLGNRRWFLKLIWS